MNQCGRVSLLRILSYFFSEVFIMATTISDKINKAKVAIYIRVSTRYQIDKDSLLVQRRELVAYTEMVLGISDYVIFEDPGYSAKNTDRPDYQRMMDRLRTGEFTHLLVWKIDRISRNLLDFASMYDELKKLGIAFVSKNEQFDTSNAVGEAMLKIILVFAELERQMTSERVTAVMLSRANNGQWNGGRVPYGYDYDKTLKQFAINSQEMHVCNIIWDTYEQYQSLLYVSRHLNSLGIRTRAGKEWSPTGIHKILTNVFYTGDYLYNVHSDGKGSIRRKESEWVTIKDHHEPAITRERYERIQFILKRNKRGGADVNETRINKNIHIFGGLIRCGVCGSTMSATLDRRRADGWRPSIYGCSRRRKNSAACLNKYVSDKTLGPFVFNYIANIIRAKSNVSASTPIETLERKLLRGDAFSEVEHIDNDSLKLMLELLLHGSTGMEYLPPVINSDSSHINERDILEDRRRKLETALNRLKALYLYGDEDTSESDYIIQREEMVNELTEIEARLAEIQENDAGAPITSDEFIQKASYFIMVEKLLDNRYIDYEKYIRRIDPSIPRSFLHTIIQEIKVIDGRVTSITFKNGMTHKFTYKTPEQGSV